ncbi:hypothetical protein FA13DRAFT_1715350 [Coprinellus micaceus]|uniref:Uncharacterized protein n=1 Tax=Coprinellus micaceus TaxID=71717 RepID=A0A4Y7SNW3_COPMI|nr:hypothetical protein FA13DRAFT_1715350 [Coprinellus micaceus]
MSFIPEYLLRGPAPTAQNTIGNQWLAPNQSTALNRVKDDDDDDADAMSENHDSDIDMSFDGLPAMSASSEDEMAAEIEASLQVRSDENSDCLRGPVATADLPLPLPGPVPALPGRVPPAPDARSLPGPVPSAPQAPPPLPGCVPPAPTPKPALPGRVPSAPNAPLSGPTPPALKAKPALPGRVPSAPPATPALPGRVPSAPQAQPALPGPVPSAATLPLPPTSALPPPSRPRPIPRLNTNRPFVSNITSRKTKRAQPSSAPIPIPTPNDVVMIDSDSSDMGGQGGVSPDVIWVSDDEDSAQVPQPGSSTGPGTRQAAVHARRPPPLVNLNAIEPIVYSRPLTAHESLSLAEATREFTQLYQELNTLNLIQSMQLRELQTLEAAARL